MRVVLLAFLLALTCIGFSQEAMQPTARVAQLKAAGTTFSTFAPFSAASQLRAKDYADICDDCKVFNADPAMIYRYAQQSPDQLLMQIPQRGAKPLELELYQVDLFAGGQLNIETSDGQVITDLPSTGKHFRGIIKGETNSIVAISIYEEDVMGLISSPSTGDWVLAQVDDKPGEYLYYEAADLSERHSFDCATEDSYQPYRKEELAPQTGLRSSSDACLQVYLEIDNDVYQDKGGTQGTVEYITGIFNEVAVLYANENVNIQLSKLFIWSGTSPYSATNSYDMLRQFQATRTSIDGDVGQLISYQASGGIAVVDGLCQSRTEYKLSFSSISKSYRTVPTFSYTVMVIAHELGHILGSQHTHACVWNGNSTAIDGCAGFVEGNCATPSIPAGGGTIMSYCHITGVGINFSQGFGSQPGNLIRNRIAGASCLQVCSTSGGGDNPPDNGNPTGGSDLCAKVSFELTLDLFGSETSWDIRDAGGNLVTSGSGYENKKAGQVITENLCLAEGCYTLTIKDSDADGICCTYGQGGFVVKDSIGTVLTSGGQFAATDTKEFCVVAPDPGSDDGGDDNTGGDDDDANCVTVNFNEVQIQGFGGSQDRGTADIIENGKGVFLQGNAWKGIPLAYNITSETVIRFDFKSTQKPEIAGFGMDENTSISSTRTFQLFGTQSWGIRTYKNYEGNGNWKTYEIPIGSFYTGQMQYLFFAADHDRSPRNGNASFRNFYLYESTPCNASPGTANLAPATQRSQINVFPNPGNERVFFDIQASDQDLSNGQLEIYNMYGQKVRAITIKESGTIQIKTQNLAPGTYLYRLNGLESEYTGKFSVQR